jgi:tRNA pseudouridine55 synthase
MNVVINLNKTSGVTSRHAVSKVKQMLSARKAGHAGTLDPMATGVLLICLNEATKITRFFIGMDKQYHARMKLGERTDTCDTEGKVIDKKDISTIKKEDIIKTVKMFEGRINQRPPMHSAVKVKGRILYTLARKGIEIERPERTVEIYSIAVTDISLPYVGIDVSCSKGTYVRTLADDIGLRLGTGAHLTALERTRIGHFNLNNAVSLDDIRSGKAHCLSVDAALAFLNEVCLDRKESEKARNGGQLAYYTNKEFRMDEFVKLKDPEGKVFGIGRMQPGCLKPERIFNI